MAIESTASKGSLNDNPTLVCPAKWNTNDGFEFSKLIIKLLKSLMDVVNKVIFSFIPSLSKLDLLVFRGSLEVP